MKIMITMTDAEVREAIKTWLDEHGVPSNDFRIEAATRPKGQAYLNPKATAETLSVHVVTEAPHMEGPYR